MVLTIIVIIKVTFIFKKKIKFFILSCSVNSSALVMCCPPLVWSKNAKQACKMSLMSFFKTEPKIGSRNFARTPLLIHLCGE